MSEAADVLGGLYEPRKDIDCTLPIEMPVIDRWVDFAAIGVVISYRPLKYLVVFNGSQPDMDPFLIRKFLYLPPPAGGGPLDIQCPGAHSLYEEYGSIMSRHRHGIARHAEDRPTFSYIRFEGK